MEKIEKLDFNQVSKPEQQLYNLNYLSNKIGGTKFSDFFRKYSNL
jgi:hypothetical protein